MKTYYKTLFFLIFIPAFAIANNGKLNGKYTKEKKIEKEFSVNADALVKVSNSYGNVNVTTWNENRIEIKITITTNGDNEEEVQRRLDEIDVDFTATKSLVSAKTIFEKRKTNWSFWGFKSNNVNMKINYTIKMPIKNNVDLSNNYGAISLNKLEGNARISCDYGKLILGELLGNDNQLRFDYTNNSTISFLNNGTIHADYSGFVVDKATHITLNGDYTKSEFTEVENLSFDCDYGKVIVGRANEIIGKGNYVTKDIGTIFKRIDLKTNYGKITINRVAKGAKNIIINSSYTSIRLGFDANSNFDFSAILSYASLKGKELLNLSNQNEQGTKKDYTGTYGTKNSGNQISITSSYGGVTIIKN
ncbi:MAG: hypothetical protein CVU03_05620 [Bacteroidetes bacterium HGW-Bacteroidetes-2]|jgi:hypothetical protein|nr:MAG: hypothetical protein CVU03_05620 [Bacteroidetes bacterium HGW-Bacteroidetes-2]